MQNNHKKTQLDTPKVHKLILDCPEFYSLYVTCHSHGWKNLAPFSWDNSTSHLRFALRVNKDSLDVSICQKGAIIEAVILSKAPLLRITEKIISVAIRRCLGLDIETLDLLRTCNKIDRQYAMLVRRGCGRLLRAPTLWEDAAKTLFTTNCSWGLTKKMCEAACSESFSSASPSGKVPFPPPHEFSRYSVSSLRQLMPIGYRSSYLKSLSEFFVKDNRLEFIDVGEISPSDVKKVINGLPGFGPYATAHLMVLAGYFEEIPIDSVVSSFLKNNYGTSDPASFVNNKYRRWGFYKWWGLKFDQILRNQNWLGD